VAELIRQSNQLMDAGRYAEAINPAREVLEILTRLLGSGRWETVDARFRVDLLSKLASLPAEGRRAMASAYSECRRAMALDGKAQHGEAEAVHRAVLEICRQWLGEEHLETLAAYIDLGVCLRNQGRNADALAPLQRALDISRTALGEDHLFTAKANNELAVT